MTSEIVNSIGVNFVVPGVLDVSGPLLVNVGPVSGGIMQVCRSGQIGHIRQLYRNYSCQFLLAGASP